MKRLKNKKENTKKENTIDVSIPTIQSVDQERKRLRRSLYYRQALRGTISVLIVVAAIAVLITTLFLPILQISGDSMAPTLEHDEILVLLKTTSLDRGRLLPSD